LLLNHVDSNERLFKHNLSTAPFLEFVRSKQKPAQLFSYLTAFLSIVQYYHLSSWKSVMYHSADCKKEVLSARSSLLSAKVSLSVAFTIKSMQIALHITCCCVLLVYVIRFLFLFCLYMYKYICQYQTWSIYNGKCFTFVCFTYIHVYICIWYMLMYV